jgi:hypothetical protein
MWVSFKFIFQEDAKPNEARQRDADRLAEKYSDLPVGELIKKLGGKS